MILTLLRYKTVQGTTVGRLYHGPSFICHTLEDAIRDVKIKGETAIPAGTYKIAVTMSNRFKKPLPLLLNVPNYEGIRIHPGNTKEDTEGCILPGTTVSSDGLKVYNSRIAFDKLFKLIQTAIDKNEPVTIEIHNPEN